MEPVGKYSTPVKQNLQYVGTGYGSLGNFLNKINPFNLQALRTFGRVKKRMLEDQMEIDKNSLQRRARYQEDSFTYDSNFGMGEYYNIVYQDHDTNKILRINEWRRMANTLDVSDALDELCDESIVHDEDTHKILDLIINKPELIKNQNAVENLTAAFEDFIKPFTFNRKGWQYFRDFLVEGELAFEFVVDHQDTRKGMIGAIRIPIETLEVIRDGEDPIGFIQRLEEVGQDNITYNTDEVIYVESSIFNEDKTQVLSFINRVMKVWRQLGLMEDALVIYRIVRAPERRVFYIDIGKMPKTRAEEYIKNLISKYHQKKVYDPQSGQINNQYAPIMMLEDYWLPVRSDSRGSKVETLAGGQNLSDIEDINFFLKKMYKGLKIPISRLSEQSTVFSDGKQGEVTRDELRFARSIMRLQDQFASGLKSGFMTHLIFTGLWDDYDLHENDIELRFNEPTNFSFYKNQEIFAIKAQNYSAFAEDEYFSKEFLVKWLLSLTPQQIEENRLYKEKEGSALAGAPGSLEGGGPGGGAPPLPDIPGGEGEGPVPGIENMEGEVPDEEPIPEVEELV